MSRFLWSVVLLAACSGKSSDLQVVGGVRALAADADGLVVAIERDQKSSIQYLPTTGGPVTIKNGAWSIMAVTLEADTIYWADLKHLRAAKRGATTFEDVARPDDHTIDDMAIVGPAMYWTADGAVWKAAKAGGPTSAIEKVWAPTTCRASRLAATSSGLVASCTVVTASSDHETQIWKLGGTTAIATTPGVILALVSDGTRIAWTTQQGKQLASYELGASAAIPLPEVRGKLLAMAGSSIIWFDNEATYRTDATTTKRIAGYATSAAIARDQVVLGLPVPFKGRATVTRVPLR